MAATDWEAIEREYRAGQLSIREIAREHGLSDGAIRKRAKAEGWQRDLSGQVRQAVRTELVRSEVRTDNARTNDAEAVQVAAARGVEVVRQHRGRLATLNQIADNLTARLKRMLDDLEQNRIVEIEERDPKTKQVVEVHKVPAPGQWIGQIDKESAGDLMKKLSDTTAKLIPLERQAFNLDEPGNGDGDHLTPDQKRKMAELYLEG